MGNLTFLTFVTWTIDLWPWPSNSSEILWRWMCMPTLRSIGPTVQPLEYRQTDRWTDRRHTDRRTGPRTLPLLLTREVITAPLATDSYWCWRLKYSQVLEVSKLSQQPVYWCVINFKNPGQIYYSWAKIIQHRKKIPCTIHQIIIISSFFIQKQFQICQYETHENRCTWEIMKKHACGCRIHACMYNRK